MEARGWLMACSECCSTISRGTRSRKAIRSCKQAPRGSDSRNAGLSGKQACFPFWHLVAERPEFSEEPLDNLLIEKLRVFGGEDGETDPVVATAAIQKRVFVNPPDLFVRKEVDFEHLKSIAHAAPGIF